MKNKGFAQVLILLIIALVGIGGYLAYRNGYLKITSSPSPAPKQDENWKTYNGNSFSFKYPQNLIPYQLEDVVMFFDTPQRVESCELKLAPDYCTMSTFSFSGVKKVSSSTYDESGLENDPLLGLESYTDSQSRNWQTFMDFGEVYNFYATLSKDGVNYQISIQAGPLLMADGAKKFRSFANKLLSTFEFMIPNLKHTSEECGIEMPKTKFSLTLPPGWGSSQITKAENSGVLVYQSAEGWIKITCGDGFGGGCDEEFRTNFMVGDTKINGCYNGGTLWATYLKIPDQETPGLSITSNLKNESLLRQILTTFEFTN